MDSLGLITRQRMRNLVEVTGEDSFQFEDADEDFEPMRLVRSGDESGLTAS
jgi:hypothetical protein